MFKKIVIASAVLIAAMSASAQSTVTLGGTINPPSCDLTIATNKADYGAMSANTIKNYTVATTGGVAHYPLLTKPLSYSVKCDAPVRVQLAFSDSNAGKASVYASGMEWAVVDASNASVGFVSLAVTHVINANTTAVYPGTVVASPTGLSTWSATYGTSISAASYVAPGLAFGFSTATNATSPAQVSQIDGSVTMATYLKKSYVDAATSIFTIALGGTITLQYL